ncbi:PAS domain S-box protein [Pelotomaculum propionicicum]|uniref:Putative diguanylate cyclase YegE n=1 Tax=Pelotomaculum propionicicum TaxID=258475 RepID=A0A4Y7RQH8_9FIRM|nr:PAS domain S-box protein [Pelotomaculum propionicicum]TEB11278.1 putative diguanylate cyclase YegE [Pelotomaculum propionicicum]
MIEHTQLFAKAIEVLTQPFVARLLDGSMLMCNRAFCDITGYSEKELRSMKKKHGLVPPGWVDYKTKALEELCRTGQPQRFEIEYLRKDGSHLPVEILIYLVNGADSTPLYYYMFVNDITKRRQAEEALQLSEERYRQLIENAPLGIAVFDTKGQIKTVNKALMQIFGTPEDEVMRINVLEYPPFVQAGLPGDIHKCMETGETVVTEHPYTTRWGNNIHLRLHLTPLRDTNGVINGVQAILEDFTDRKRTEEELINAHQKLMDIIESLPDATFVIDKDRKVIAWNQAMEELTGTPKAEILGKGDYAYGVPLYGEPRPVMIDLAFGEDKQTEEKYDYVTKEGNIFYAEAFLPAVRGGKGAYLWGKISRLYDREGRLIGAIESIRDITERKRTEEQLKYLSLHDPLTGLYNRTFFEDSMRRAGDGRFSPVGIIVCDLDGLKFINDTLGHDAGDSLLENAAAVIEGSFRQSDIVSRIGGDEFAILLIHSDEKTVEDACNRLRHAIDRYNEARPEIPLSISMRFAVSTQSDHGINELFKEADNNMYREKLHCSQSARSAIVQTLMKALEARDFITEGHAVRLQEFVTILAGAIDLPKRNISDLNLLAKFHDIGKVGVSDNILFKPGNLSSEEAAEMRRHCEIGYRIAQSAPDLAPIAEWILKHHEWWNGKGYPQGLKGEEIPLECRILAIADAYDAMTNNRPYRKAMTHHDAVRELKRCSGTQFDPHLVDKFVDVLSKSARPEKT